MNMVVELTPDDLLFSLYESPYHLGNLEDKRTGNEKCPIPDYIRFVGHDIDLVSLLRDALYRELQRRPAYRHSLHFEDDYALLLKVFNFDTPSEPTPYRIKGTTEDRLRNILRYLQGQHSDNIIRRIFLQEFVVGRRMWFSSNPHWIDKPRDVLQIPLGAELSDVDLDNLPDIPQMHWRSFRRLPLQFAIHRQGWTSRYYLKEDTIGDLWNELIQISPAPSSGKILGAQNRMSLIYITLQFATAVPTKIQEWILEYVCAVDPTDVWSPTCSNDEFMQLIDTQYAA